MVVQENNKRNNHYYLFKGEMKTLSQIAKEYHISRNSLYYMVNVVGKNLEMAVTELTGQTT